MHLANEGARAWPRANSHAVPDLAAPLVCSLPSGAALLEDEEEDDGSGGHDSMKMTVGDRVSTTQVVSLHMYGVVTCLVIYSHFFHSLSAGVAGTEADKSQASTRRHSAAPPPLSCLPAVSSPRPCPAALLRHRRRHPPGAARPRTTCTGTWPSSRLTS